MTDIKYTLEQIKKNDWYHGQIESVKALDSTSPIYGQLSPPLMIPLQNYLKYKGIDRLYTHQVYAIEKIRQGESVIITTSTASGKSLCYNLPIFEAITKSPKITALYLYPLKALTNDQYLTLREMEEYTRININVAVYDGDTPVEQRKILRENSKMILSNPYELHYVLSYHSQWTQFYKNLKFIVIDEAHQYRGVFGSNIAFVIRRLLRICSYYGSNPIFILSSASIANPDEFAEKLTTKKCYVISNDGAPKSKKYLLFWNPVKYQDRSVHTQTRDLFQYFTKSGLQTLCFVFTRKLTELIVNWAKKDAPELNIVPYRSGYFPEERREVEKGLKEKRIQGVVSTIALELGIDIGGLDCVIISGYPGTIASFWQQAGRAGRKAQDALIVFIAFEETLNQFILHHPDFILSRNFENAVIDIHNPHIIKGHTLCAASELPIKSNDEYFHVDELIKDGRLIKTSNGWEYNGWQFMPDFVSLNNISDSRFKILCNGDVLEEAVDKIRTFRDAHTGAVWLNKAETYLIEKLDIENSVINAVKKDVDYWTEAVSQKSIYILNEEHKSDKFNFGLYFGNVNVTEQYTHFKIKKYDKVLPGDNIFNLPPLKFNTKGLWFNIDSEIIRTCENQTYKNTSGDEKKLDFAGGIYALEHAMIAISPLLSMCDRRDIGGISYPLYSKTKQPTIFIYDAFEGGIGISEKLFDKFSKLLMLTHKLIKECDCEDGCPSCVLSHKCGSNNNPIDKRAAIVILEGIINNKIGNMASGYNGHSQNCKQEEETMINGDENKKDNFKDDNEADNKHYTIEVESFNQSSKIRGKYLEVNILGWDRNKEFKCNCGTYENEICFYKEKKIMKKPTIEDFKCSIFKVKVENISSHLIGGGDSQIVDNTGYTHKPETGLCEYLQPRGWLSQAYELYDGTNANLYLLFPELDDDIDIVRFIYRQNIYNPGETSGWVRDRETFDFRLKKEISSQKGKTVNSQKKVKESSYQTDKQTDIPCSVTNTKEECKGEGVSEKLSYEKFTKKAIVSLRTPGYKGIHAKLSGFNEAFRKYFPGKNPVEITKKLAEDEKIVIRPVKGGVMLYLPEDAPAYKIGGDDTLKRMGLS